MSLIINYTSASVDNVGMNPSMLARHEPIHNNAENYVRQNKFGSNSLISRDNFAHEIRGREQTQTSQQLHPLLKQANTASIGLLFGLLIWRSLTAYELADQFSSSSLRIVCIPPVVIILIANIAGFLVNIIKPLNFKTHLKLILASNIVREWLELIYNVFKIVFTNSTSSVSRENYFGRFFMNVWWSILCISFARSRWVLQLSGENQPGNHSANQQPRQNSNRKYGQY